MFTCGPAFFNGAAADSDFASVVALLHMDGADASTTFTDQKGHTFTAGGNAQIDTAESKFGGASMLCDGTGDYITSVDSADWDTGSGNFTVEMFAKFNAVGATNQYVFGQCNSSLTASTTSIAIRKDSTTNKISGFACVGGATVGLATSTAAVTTGVWYHIAYVRNGTGFTIYLDGTGVASGTTSSSALNNSTNALSIGRAGERTTETFNGWIDEFRFTKGVARYTSNFTPPSAPFADS